MLHTVNLKLKGAKENTRGMVWTTWYSFHCQQTHQMQDRHAGLREFDLMMACKKTEALEESYLLISPPKQHKRLLYKGERMSLL